MWVQAKEFVFLGAGALGTTEILLRSRAYGLKLSPCLGMNMSGNGDMLAFGHNTARIVNAIGREDRAYLAKHPVGPCITGVIDMRNEDVAPNVLDGYVIEEGVAPEALAPFLEAMFELIPGQIEPQSQTILDRVREKTAKAENDVHGPWKHGGSLNRTMFYLIMSHDDNQATLTLENNKPRLRYPGGAKSEQHKFITSILEKATDLIGGTYIKNPLLVPELGDCEIAVHPLGGANMSSDGTGESGVTNHLGQVFEGLGSEVYDSLVVVDGAVIPSALAVNPFATITALAERSVEGVANEKGITINYEYKGTSISELFSWQGAINWVAPQFGRALEKDMEQAQIAIAKSSMRGGARFTEILEGHLYVGDDIDDFSIAAEAAKGLCSTAKFYLSVDAWDINALVDKSNHAAMLTGTFSCGALPNGPFLVLRGEFQLFSQDPETPDTENLVYDFDMRSVYRVIISTDK
jgi:GMC oxidoreductase